MEFQIGRHGLGAVGTVGYDATLHIRDRLFHLLHRVFCRIDRSKLGSGGFYILAQLKQLS